MITWLAISAYAVMWLVFSAFFTRHWVVKSGCVEECKRERYRKVEHTHDTEWTVDSPVGECWVYAWRGNHHADCNSWQHEPLDPADAMGVATMWPLTGIYFAMTFVHRYEPKPKPGKLTQKHIDYLDTVLDDESITQLEMRKA